MTLNVVFDLGPYLRSLLEGRIVALFDDLKSTLEDLSATVDAEKTQVLDAIAALELKLAALNVTPEQAAELASIVGAIKAKVEGIVEPTA